MDFVLAFGATSLRAKDLKKCISRVVERIGVDKVAGIWDTVSQAVGQDRTLLQATNAVLIYRERGGEQTLSRRIGVHYPPLRPWGFQFKGCGTEECRPQTSKLLIRNSHGKVQIHCQRCLWKSAAVGENDVKGHFFSLGGKTPNVYWHNFPASQELKEIFKTITSKQGVDAKDVSE